MAGPKQRAAEINATDMKRLSNFEGRRPGGE